MSHAIILRQYIRRCEWERVAVLLLLGLEITARNAPSGTIDDVLALLSEDADDTRR